MANYIHVPPGSPEVPKLDIALSDVDGPGCRDGALQLLRRLRPHWSPEEVTLQASCLTDGDAVPWRQHINRVGVCFKVPVMILQDRLSSVSILYVWLKHDHAGPQYSACT